MRPQRLPASLNRRPRRLSETLVNRRLPATIVLVEDDSSLRNALAFALEEEGYKVRAYDRGGSALAADQADADCLVIDLKLPDIDGLDLIDRLRTLGSRAPAIIITTNPDARQRRQAEGAGVAIVEKPLLDGRLRVHIDAAVARGRGAP